jgi:hypothetical protein
MIRNHKGYSLIQWVLLIGVVIGIITISQSVLTKSVETKMWQTAAYVLWSSWQDTPDWTEASDYNNRRSATKVVDMKRIIRHENHAGEIRSRVSPSSYRKSRTMSTSVIDSVGEGLEDYFLDQVPIEVGDPGDL